MKAAEFEELMDRITPGAPIFPARWGAVGPNGATSASSIVWHAFRVAPVDASDFDSSECGEVRYSDVEPPRRLPRQVSATCERCAVRVGAQRFAQWVDEVNRVLAEPRR